MHANRHLLLAILLTIGNESKYIAKRKTPSQSKTLHPHQTDFAPESSYTRSLLRQATVTPEGFDARIVKQLCTRNLWHQKPFTPKNFCTRKLLQLTVLHQIPSSPNSFCTPNLYTRYFLHLFTPHGFDTRYLLHQTPFVPDTFHTMQFTPDTFYARNFLHQTVFTPDTFSTTRFLNQTIFTPKGFNIRNFLPQNTFSAPDAFLPSHFYTGYFYGKLLCENPFTPK